LDASLYFFLLRCIIKLLGLQSDRCVFSAGNAAAIRFDSQYRRKGRLRIKLSSYVLENPMDGHSHILCCKLGFTFRKREDLNPACSNVLAAIGNNAVACSA
jgi:hypothetical protein